MIYLAEEGRFADRCLTVDGLETFEVGRSYTSVLATAEIWIRT